MVFGIVKSLLSLLSFNCFNRIRSDYFCPELVQRKLLVSSAYISNIFGIWAAHKKFIIIIFLTQEVLSVVFKSKFEIIYIFNNFARQSLMFDANLQHIPFKKLRTILRNILQLTSMSCCKNQTHQHFEIMAA